MPAIASCSVHPSASKISRAGRPGSASSVSDMRLRVDPALPRDTGERLAHGIRVHERVVEIEDDVARLHCSCDRPERSGLTGSGRGGPPVDDQRVQQRAEGHRGRQGAHEVEGGPARLVEVGADLSEVGDPVRVARGLDGVVERDVDGDREDDRDEVEGERDEDPGQRVLAELRQRGQAVSTSAPTKPPTMNQGLMIARSRAWKDATNVRSSVVFRAGMIVWA